MTSPPSTVPRFMLLDVLVKMHPRMLEEARAS